MTDFYQDEAPDAINPADVRLAAMNLLARREHSRQELFQKLKKRFGDAALIERQLDQLVAENLQSDARYAESFVRQRFNRGHGPLRIRQEMRQKEIPEAEIQAAMGVEEYDWAASAERVWHSKFGSAPSGDVREKARRVRFMQYRGFSHEDYQHLAD